MSKSTSKFPFLLYHPNVLYVLFAYDAISEPNRNRIICSVVSFDVNLSIASLVSRSN